ncbi:mechanosensitive ion channel family protein [Aurantiacibacter xanthus]|uniref:Mechanosensitive ion channel family protein n=1 Tax=Aurantiacibacter xanthus TaxID=1784712 RepID=A0A3A1NZN6_9SPHN|nr:mechanosensitive ion channel family protein [Aurantiacibacter xanthus]RIV81380.1 mechanosensitive ion channel family protein [Aurantiacibacter xanthus]
MPNRALIERLELALVVLALAVACALTSTAAAQTESPAEATATPAPATDPLGRETPRGTVTGLLNALGRQDYAGASAYFENVDPDKFREQDAQLARALKASLDGGGELLSYLLLSNDPLGKRDDQLPPDQERVGALGDDEQTPILLVRSDAMDTPPVWRVSQETLDHLTIAPADEQPASDQGVQVAGAPLPDWLKLLGAAGGSFLFYWLATAGVLWLVRRAFAEAQSKFVLNFIEAALPPASLLLAVITFQFWTQGIEASIVARQAILRYIGIAGWIALAWFALRLIDAVARTASNRMERTARRQGASLVVLIRRTCKIAAVALALLAIFDTLGFDVTTGVAALGVGGLALALGAQKTVENLVGCITVIADRPVEVGDYCRVGDTLGTVTDIGIRSTKLRTTERTHVTIPNSDFASERIENYSRRDRFLFNPRIGLTYDTDAAGMREALRLVRKVVDDNERVFEEDARVRFVDLGASSLNIEIYAYIAAPTYPDSLEVREELLLAIMDELERGGFSFAFPTQTIHLHNAPGAAGQPDTARA